MADLGEGIENFESEVENLKNKKMKLFGITMTPTTIGMLFAVLSTITGGLYASFQVYDDYMGMKEIVENIDIEAIQAENALVVQKMADNMTRIEEAIEYTRDIKSGLRDDILGIEKQVDRMDDKIREQEEDTRDTIANAEERFENKRDGLQNDYDTKANSLRNSNDSRMTDLEAKVDRDIENMLTRVDRKVEELEETLNGKLQRALDNPLAN
tara:strand:- start:2200 stop:2835 length:636 start_codon:yes stop_codon:yes gene_type:complete